MLIDLPRRDVVVPAECDAKVPFVVPKIQISFTPIVQDKAFSVPLASAAYGGRLVDKLQRLFSLAWLLLRKRVETHVHKTGIRVQVRIDLDTRDRQTGRFQEQTGAAGDDALSHTGDNTTGDKNILHPGDQRTQWRPSW